MDEADAGQAGERDLQRLMASKTLAKRPAPMPKMPFAQLNDKVSDGSTAL
jgi:hypothetical protein